MAKRTVVTLIDDVDGSAATETVMYGIDGSLYAIDLNEVNASELREALAPYLSVSRRLGALPGQAVGADPGRPAVPGRRRGSTR